MTSTTDPNFAFGMNIDGMACESFEVIEGHVLRRANRLEMEVIRWAMDKMPSPQQFMVNYWETTRPSEGPSRSLPETEWRYYVIEFRGANSMISIIENAFDLTVELHLGFTEMHHDGGGRGRLTSPYRIFQTLNQARLEKNDFFIKLENQDLVMIKCVCRQILEHNHAVLDLNRPLMDLDQLHWLPSISPLRFLGYFALLESMLTHSPKKNDPYDSITRQVRSKLALLNNRWTIPLDYSAFSDTNHDTIWNKMYDYRSQLAHGGRPDFKHRELIALRDASTAFKLLKQTTKNVLRQALEEPQLLADLKNC